VHLRQLELGFGADSGREGCVADDVSESLSLCLVGLEDLALCVVAQGSDVNEAAQIELLGAEHRHDGRFWRGLSMI
jgi:hypothetical protein